MTKKTVGTRKTLAGEIEVVDNRAQHERALDVLMAVHLAGFTNVFLKSVVMFNGGVAMRTKQVEYVSLYVVVDEDEVVADRYDQLAEVAATFGCQLQLRSLKLDGSYSRLALWVRDAV